MVTLYGSSQSRSFRALWALEEADIKYTYHPVRIGRRGKDGTQSDDYKKLNYQGKVPTLVDDDLVIIESAAILNYIARLAPLKNLIPIDNSELESAYDVACYFTLTELEQPLWTAAKHSFALPKQFRLAGIKKVAEWEFAKALTTLEHYLNDQQFIVNNIFTMADILIAHTLHWAIIADYDVSERLTKYCERLYQRPACQRAIKAQQLD
ncbi:MAG: glutathione S-transferase family protein [Piscirickettsiaceae bacterium]|nr:glutathione S-transferase family protein [Piscirickettsiaceae bacterium]